MTFIETLLYWLMLMSQPNVDGAPGVQTPDRSDRDTREQSVQDYRDDEHCGCEDDKASAEISTKKKTYSPRWGRISNGL